LLLLVLIGSRTARSENDALEYAVKAAYLCKLPPFIDWPAGTLPTDAFVLCIVGHGPFRGLLDSAAEGADGGPAADRGSPL
jgi:hypothetical protein